MSLPYRGARLVQIAGSMLRRSKGWDAHRVRYRVTHSNILESVRRTGVIEPLVVEKWRGGYRIICGFVRAAAAEAAGVEKVPALVLAKRPSRQEALRIALTSNAPGTTLTDVDRAFALAKARVELGLSDTDLAREVAPLLGLPESFKVVRQYIELITLPRAALDAAATGTLSRQHLEAMLAVAAPDREEFLSKAVLGLGLSASETRVFAEGLMDLACRHGRAFGALLGEALGAPAGGGKAAPPVKAKAAARERLARMLQPSIRTMEDEFQALSRELALPQDASISHTLSFESDELRIAATISSTEDARRLAEALGGGVARGVLDKLLTISPRMTARILEADRKRGR